MRALRFALLLCCALHAPGALAFNAVIGDTAVVVPEPPGYLDARNVSAQLQQYGQSLAPQSNRVLGFLVQKEDQQRIAANLGPQLKRYHLVQVNRSMEAPTITLKQFEELREAIRAQAASGLESARADVDRELAQRSKQMAKASGDPSLSVKLGQTTTLGLYEDRATAIGFLTNVSFPRVVNGKEEVLPVVVATSVTLVKGKALFLYTYFIRTSDADVAAARQSARAWLAAVEKANQPLKK
jgi:hypothetical protein